MDKFNLKRSLIIMVAMGISLTRCQAIASIFKAGVWVGVVGIILVIVIIFWLVSKAGKK